MKFALLLNLAATMLLNGFSFFSLMTYLGRQNGVHGIFEVQSWPQGFKHTNTL